jgi:hypothetical protein
MSQKGNFNRANVSRFLLLPTKHDGQDVIAFSKHLVRISAAPIVSLLKEGHGAHQAAGQDREFHGVRPAG